LDFGLIFRSFRSSLGFSLPTDRHARSERGAGNARLVLLSLLAGGFATQRIKAPGAAPLSFRRSRRLEATFRSPVATACFQATSAGSPFRICLFRVRRNWLAGPFGSDSFPRLPFKLRGRSTPFARFLLHFPPSLGFHGPGSPSEVLPPSGSTLVPLPPREACLRETPLPYTPRRPQLISPPPSDHRLGSASFRYISVVCVYIVQGLLTRLTLRPRHAAFIRLT
jgi:hypothetical protein